MSRISGLFVSAVLAVLGGTIAIGATRKQLNAAPLSGPKPLFSVFYAPTENLELIDVTRLRGATQTIDFAAYSLTDEAIIQTLTDAAKRGVQVTVFLDRDQTISEMRRPALAAALINLAGTQNATVLVKNTATLQHLKSYVVDNQVLRTGSANFSRNALQVQDNDLLLSEDPTAVHAFEQNFRAMTSFASTMPLSSVPRYETRTYGDE